MNKGFLGGAHASEAPTRLEQLKANLSDAKDELRRKRAWRLQAEQRGPGAEMPLRPMAAPGATSVDPEALEALASHPDPPPEALRRLAQALTLLQEAEGLVDLGEHPLPGQTSWKNLRALLGNSIEPCKGPGEIGAILSRPPHGPRLADHVRQEVLGFGSGQALTRHEVCEADARCGGLFDFVALLLRPAAAPESQEPLEDTRGRALEAVERQEREVALLRRRLHEVERQEAAAAAFASKHATATAAQAAISASRQEPHQDHRADARLRRDAKERRECLGSTADEPSREPVKEEFYANSYVATHNTSIQYRLNETDVPQLQVPALEMLARLLVHDEQDPRRSAAAAQRRLELRGCCDSREEVTVASIREATVREWLRCRGVPRERVLALEPSVPAEGLVDGAANSKRGSRTVELRLFERQPVADSNRRRARDLLRQLGLGDEPAAARAPAPRASPGEAPVGLSVDGATATGQVLRDEGAGSPLRVALSKHTSGAGADVALDELD